MSPCVLPLAPGFVGMITGLSAEQLQARGESHSKTILMNALLFVLGFSLLFISLGASAGAVGRFLSAHRESLNRVAGAGVIFFGLALLGVMRFRFLDREVRFQRVIPQGKFRSFALGLAFAFGWTPCAGPALAAMLLMAATRPSMWQGTRLLAVYSAGMALPFAIIALSLSRFLAVYHRMRRYLIYIERFGGALLIGAGILLFFDKLSEVAFWFNQPWAGG